MQEFEEVLKEANLTDSLELLSVTVEEGKLGEAVQEGEEGKQRRTHSPSTLVTVLPT